MKLIALSNVQRRKIHVQKSLSASCQNNISCCFLTSQDMPPKRQTRQRTPPLYTWKS